MFHNNELRKFTVEKVKDDVQFFVSRGVGRTCVVFEFQPNKSKLLNFMQDENLLCTLLIGREIGTSVIIERLNNDIKLILINKIRVMSLMTKEEFKTLLDGCCQFECYSTTFDVRVYD